MKNFQNKIKKFNYLNAFSEDKKRFFIRTTVKSNQIELVNWDNKRSVKKLFLGKGKTPLNYSARWKNIRFSKISKKQYFFSYETVFKKKNKTNLFFSSDLIHWKKDQSMPKINGGCLFISSRKKGESRQFLFGDKKIKLGFFNKKETSIILSARKGYFDEKSLMPASIFYHSEGILLFYYAKDNNKKLSIGAVLLDKKNPKKIIWRAALPFWREPDNQTFIPVGITKFRGKYTFFGKDEKENFHATDLPPVIFSKIKTLNKKQQDFILQPQLQRTENNPILSPVSKNYWESEAVFNPASIFLDGRVHLIYRAIGKDGISVLGYASSKDGIKIDERLAGPVYVPSQYFEFRKNNQKETFTFPYMSGGGWGGCEDPRLTVVGKRIYMTYVAFNGNCPPGVAITSIKVSDFLNKKWNWKTPSLISRPGEIQKNWVVFPEKIKGKFAILHSIAPNIMIDYFDLIEKPNVVIDSYRNNQSDDRRWDNILRGVAAPPIKIDSGWLVLYHAMDRRDPNKYKVGAMILDYENPEKILYRASQPILEPLLHYENEGFKAGVVYVCGTVIKDEKLFVYYGGADTVVCVAVAPIKEFLSSMIKSPKVVSMKKVVLV